MAKVKLNSILEQVRGQVGDLVFRQYGEKVIISRKPDLKGVEPTAAQLAQRERFRDAVLYGKRVMADPQTKAVYEEAARAQGRSVFNLAVADFLHAPSVDQVDLSGYHGAVGDEIAIRAHDDFAVKGVRVALTQVDGGAIESGEAVETPPESGRWVYAATVVAPTGTTVRIAVTAQDRPGGTAQAEQEKVV